MNAFFAMLPISVTLSTLLLFGCATPTGTVQTQEIQSLSGTPVKVTRISVPFSAPGHGNVQVADGAVWATQPSALGRHKTIRVDANSHHVAELSRPWTAGFADLLVDEHSIWLSDGMSKITGHGDLFRVDPATNQVIATIGAVGAPFAGGDGTIWAYNLRTRVVSGIDTANNNVRTQLVTTGSLGSGDFAYGGGAIWQYLRGGDIDVVRRIDPYAKKIVAEIPVGRLHHISDRIRFVAGSVWVLGEQEQSGPKFMPTAIRIDAGNNVAATIPLERSVSVCAVHATPKTPVFWSGGFWVSTFCSDVARVPGVLLQIDLQTNQVTDEIILSTLKGHLGGQPALAVGEGSLWGFDGRSAIRFNF